MESNDIIERILFECKDDLEVHFDKYRNHVYRVFNLCIVLDGTPANVEKYAIAAAFHDLGIWTDQTFDYLEPSMTLAKDYLVHLERSDWSEEICLMIDMHHKRSKYLGLYEMTVETFRRADWIDVTMGIMLFGLDKSIYRLLCKKFPNLGFHWFLTVQTFENFLKSPFDPLPMFKK